MTYIQQFVERAFVGGWRPEDRDFVFLRFGDTYFEYRIRSTATGRPIWLRRMPYEAVLLNPKVWQAVATVQGWYDGPYGPEWRHHMHRMIDAVADGKTLEEYVQFVLEKAHTQT